jgi:hypothetical protein
MLIRGKGERRERERKSMQTEENAGSGGRAVVNEVFERGRERETIELQLGKEAKELWKKTTR